MTPLHTVPGLGGTPRDPADLRIGAEVIVYARIAAVIFLAAFLVWVPAPHTPELVAVMAGAVTLHAIWGIHYIGRGHPITRRVALLSLLGDAVGTGIGVALTGGPDSPATLIWAPTVAIAGIWIGVRGAIPVLAVIAGFLGVTSFVSTGPSDFLTSGQHAVFTAFMLILVVVHGGVVAAWQRSSLVRLAAAEARAMHDPLTGLANRAAFSRQLDVEIERAARAEGNLTLALLDIDDFKSVNDTRGHLAGDDVLVDFARRLRAGIRQTDIPVRLGGEEFVVLLPDTTARTAEEIIDRLREHLRDTPIGGTVIRFSAGLAQYPVAARDADALVAAADDALYAAKRAGKDRTVVASIAATPV